MTSSVIGQIFGINEKISVWSLIALLPIFLWELGLGLWMTFKGFNKSSPLMADSSAEAGSPDRPTIAVPPVIAVAPTGGMV